MKKSRKKGPSSKIVFSLASKLSTFLQITEMTLETFQTTNFILFVEFSLTTLKWEKLPVRCLDVGETLPSIVVKADTGCTELVEVFVKGLESVDPVPNFKHVYSSRKILSYKNRYNGEVQIFQFACLHSGRFQKVIAGYILTTYLALTLFKLRACYLD